MRKIDKQKVYARLEKMGYDSIRDFAVNRGLPPSTVGSWLRDERNPKRLSLQKLADAMGCDVCDISSWVHNVNLEKINEVEQDGATIAALFSQLTAEQRRRIIGLAEQYAEINRKEAEIEVETKK